MKRLRLTYWVGAPGYWFVDSDVWIAHDSFMQFESIKDIRKFKTKRRVMKEVRKLLKVGAPLILIGCMGIKYGKRRLLHSIILTNENGKITRCKRRAIFGKTNNLPESTNNGI